MKHWKDLLVWQKSHELVLSVYSITSDFSKSERYGIVDQTRRSAASIPANIVEGHSRNSQKDFLRFLYIARGSLEELRYFLLLSRDLDFINKDNHLELEENCQQVSKLLNGLIKSLS